MATDSSPRHRRPRLLEGPELMSPPPPLGDAKGTTQEEETRDWAELPWDTLLAVLHRLDHVDVLMGAGQVCRPWRRAAREEPELWRHIDMRPHAKLASRLDLLALARAAVSRGAGRCEAFSAERVGDDEFLSFLADAAPTLKSLRLIACYRISTFRINEAIKKFPLLEELELSLFRGSGLGLDDIGFDDIGEACPLLTCFRLNRRRFRQRWGVNVINCEAMDIARMHGLRSLQLFGNSLGNAGLMAIVDGCPHLESLDIRHCFNVKMDDDIRTKCERIKTVRLPDDSMDDYGLQYDSPDMESFNYSWVMYPDN
ncbi:hypothetical protein ACP4OV_027068 [Aristida adscensionis]